MPQMYAMRKNSHGHAWGETEKAPPYSVCLRVRRCLKYEMFAGAAGAISRPRLALIHVRRLCL